MDFDVRRFRTTRNERKTPAAMPGLFEQTGRMAVIVPRTLTPVATHAEKSATSR
jgi:hypothetical protein